ncbi:MULTISPECIES: alpha-amylase family glycosyl hydrolase [unclassified Agarivorans]|uniref:alpha-amylase family glycosyl hydrolase n=1 Tax=unclassified Agarivorans TaxID=2636026 RepID=UPI0026E3A382|nr:MULTISPECIES: alpha-amylase family glycosyl hydrolase [unclassified Agarivorans]MDO6685866.1 alpha-amylase family glycosyl hydrolase [Agarivorans sp. 3_MG-2023]MDO6716019.1 alpha-amylase family glycosyl hydrolase [Agarivorans sp. 2_MG-2023]
MLAIACTLVDAEEQLDFFIRYHLSIGFDRLYLFFDDPLDSSIEIAVRYPQVVATICDASWREQCKQSLKPSSILEEGLYDQEAMVRQEANLRFALKKASKDKVSWLLHIDIDELFYVPTYDAKAHFNEVAKSGKKNILYANAEALIDSKNTTRILPSSKLFKRNFFKQNKWVFTQAQRDLLKSLGIKPEHFFHYYQNGKSAVHLDQGIEVMDVHNFKTKTPPYLWEQDQAKVLHFPCPTYDSFEKKYQRLGLFSNQWRGSPRDGLFISKLHTQSRDVAAQGVKLKEFYTSNFSLEDPATIASLQQAGLVDSIESLEDQVKSQHQLVASSMASRNKLIDKLQGYCEQQNLSANLTEPLISQLVEHIGRLEYALSTVYPKEGLAHQIIESAFKLVVQATETRLPFFRDVDNQRGAEHDWLSTSSRVGACLYVDKFAGNFSGLKARLSYLRDMGINYLYLLPPFEAHPGKNDGGFAIKDYEQIAAHLGGNSQFNEFVSLLKKYDIGLCLDFVLNHTAMSHEWAQKAIAGEQDYKNYYWLFESEQEAIQWLNGVEDTFPEQGRDISFNKELNCYIWTTFNQYQWDLNYSNPNVFLAMLEKLLSLINMGVDVLRLDAIPHIWKEKNTSCKNRPECHLLVEAYQAFASMLSPTVKLVSEAIVSPDKVEDYIQDDRTSYAYRPVLTASLWYSIMSADSSVMRHQLSRWSALPKNCNWISYVNCHDDVHWVFSNNSLLEQTPSLKINHFYDKILSFYINPTDSTFARGKLFQRARIVGSTASLAGLEKALDNSDQLGIEKSVARILLMHAVVLSIGGLPIIYMGDEVAELNDYSYVNDQDLAYDSRWIHRPKRNWFALKNALARPNSPESKVHSSLTQLCLSRKKLPVLSGHIFKPALTDSRQVFAFTREDSECEFLFLGNFSPLPQVIATLDSAKELAANNWRDVLDDDPKEKPLPKSLKPYQYYWLIRIKVKTEI